MSERVDKGWTSRGLEGYSTAAILGTLNHYGVSVDEAGFRAQAEQGSPVRIGLGWMEGWKGTGQFSRFPLAAAEALWRRLLPERATPVEFLESLSQLLVQLERLAAGKGGAPADLDAAFGQVDAVVARVPERDGARDRALFQEAFSLLSREQMQAFDSLGERLARGGQPDAARRFTALEETVLPDRAGIASAVVRAALGERAPAVDALREATSPVHPPRRRLFAVDALLHLGELGAAREAAEPLLDEVQKAEDWHAAMDLLGRLDHIYKVQGDHTAREALHARAQVIDEGHARAHPTHVRGHRH